MQAPSSSTLTLFLLGPLIACRAYARLRKLVGRQRLSKYRAPITLAIYALLSSLVAHASLAHPGRIWWCLGSLLAGVALSRFGLRHTRFEPTRSGHF